MSHLPSKVEISTNRSHQQGQLESDVTHRTLLCAHAIFSCCQESLNLSTQHANDYSKMERTKPRVGQKGNWSDWEALKQPLLSASEHPAVRPVVTRLDSTTFLPLK